MIDLVIGRLKDWAIRLALAGGVALAGACGSGGPADPGTFAAELALLRAQKDQYFRTSSESPIPPDRREKMLPIPYFPPDESYRVPALLKVAANRPVAEMPTSTGTIRKMQQVGVLEFSLKDRPLQLVAFTDIDVKNFDRLFVPFSDLTSGTETYPAGRYLDLDRTATGVYVIDFNRAYHPYCYFNATYECPYPPPQNRLPLPVRAGERLPK
ncbi:MAG: DUF1684 domain-containing protein [Acidobacteria bacterium]|nr:DUF1684 domain-containing protein [Acidobacteriota bacterium]